MFSYEIGRYKAREKEAGFSYDCGTSETSSIVVAIGLTLNIRVVTLSFKVVESDSWKMWNLILIQNILVFSSRNPKCPVKSPLIHILVSNHLSDLFSGFDDA